jgi:GPH family glycoside/pentoside/hexuronide:cation symporter
MASMTLPLTIFLPAFYATVIGLNLAVVGIIFTIVRTADLFFDPFIGGLMDRTRTRFGRFRPWLALGAPVVMGGAAMLFLASPGVGPLYLAVALIIAYGGYSIIILSQMGLGAALSPDYDERSRVFAWWQIFNIGGIILVLVLPPALALVMPVDQTTTVRSMGVAILILTPLTILNALFAVPDPAADTGGVQPHVPIGAYLKLFRLTSVRILLGTVLANGLALGISAAVFVFFFDILKNIRPSELSLMLAGFSVVSIFSAPLWAWLGSKFGKHNAMMLGGLCYASYALATVFMPERGFTFYAVIAIVGGFASCSIELLPRAMMADIVDEDRLVSKGDSSGMLYALLLITHKIGQAAAIGLVFTLLDFTGFKADAGQANAPSALFGILMLGGVVPALFYLVGSLLIYFYPITAVRHAEIRAALDRIGVGAGINPIPEMADPGHLGASVDAFTDLRQQDK